MEDSKKLRKLSKEELASLLIESYKENEELKAKLEKAEEELKNRQITIEKSGTLAEAALGINKIFDAAQQAADLYTENVIGRLQNMDKLCDEREQEAEEKAQRIIAAAEVRAREIEKAAGERVENFWRDAAAHFRSTFENKAVPEQQSDREQDDVVI